MRITKVENNITILGGGPAGLACAIELHKRNKRFLIVEKASQLGGLSKTYRFGKFSTDNGPHRFFSKNEFLNDFIKDLLNEDYVMVKRFTRFYVKGRYYIYPIEIKNILQTAKLTEVFHMALDFLKEKGKSVFIKKNPENFQDFVVAAFGQKLAEFNMLNYTEKLWGLPSNELSVDWASQRIKNLTPLSIIKSILKIGEEPRSLTSAFIYPKNGTGDIYNSIERKISKTNKILLNHYPETLEVKNRKIRKIILNSGKEIKGAKFIVSSIPVPKLLNTLEPKPSKKVLEAAHKLRFRSQVYLFITLSKRSVSKDQWIYFPDKEIPFGRISEMRNFSKAMSPKGQTSLLVEFFCWEGDITWNMTKKEISDQTVSNLVGIGLIKKKDVLKIYHFRQTDVYPVYDLNYKKNLHTVMNYLDKINNLILIGRPGRFRYTNQDHSLEMGIAASKIILTGKKINLDKIGLEGEFGSKAA